MRRNAFTPLEINIRNKRRYSLTGFTLIELIISITIFTIIIITVYSAFYMGIKTWRRGQDERSLQDIRLGLLKIEKELKNSFFFSEIQFSGTLSEMVFPLSLSDGDKKRSYIITYSVDKDERTGLKQLTRKKKIYSRKMEGIEEENEEKIKKLLPLMKEIKFEYAYKSSDPSEKFDWQESWKPEVRNKLPSGVRISLEMNDSEEIYSKVIFLQHGELGN